jgi:hypothetical protein
MGFRDVKIKAEEKSRPSSRDHDLEQGLHVSSSEQLIAKCTSEGSEDVENEEEKEKKIWIFWAVSSLQKLRYLVRLAIYFLPLTVVFAVAFAFPRQSSKLRMSDTRKFPVSFFG